MSFVTCKELISHTLMNLSRNIQDLENLLEGSKKITVEDTDSADFTFWRNQVLRSLTRIYGAESIELKQFESLDFSFSTPVRFLDRDYSNENLQCFRKGLKIATEALQTYVRELKIDLENTQLNQFNSKVENLTINKVFISHSSNDKEIVGELIDLLEAIGLNHTQIFCSSFPEYGIELGENFLMRLKNELDSNILVLFILSKNFYESPMSMCEMGATWVKTNQHIPILIPPFNFSEIKGAIPHTQGLYINDKLNLNLLKDKIEKLFSLNTLNSLVWESKRDKILERINVKLNGKPVKSSSGFGYRVAKR